MVSDVLELASIRCSSEKPSMKDLSIIKQRLSCVALSGSSEAVMYDMHVPMCELRTCNTARTFSALVFWYKELRHRIARRATSMSFASSATFQMLPPPINSTPFRPVA